MPVRGTLKTTTLKIAKLEVDYLHNPVKVHTLAALVNEETGSTVAWTEGNGGVWSSETMVKLRELVELMEEDIAKKVFLDGGDEVSTTRRAKPGLSMEGLGEHVGGDDAPSI